MATLSLPRASKAVLTRGVGGGRGGDVAVQEGEEGALERRKYVSERVGFPVGPQRPR